uniref:TMV resistance protein N-like n=1 Tax=Fragaria vesca subsp. vesca TaxID=101020 RepID=UPI0005C81A0E|nr:PREDICTED: TMV resistance protein N-like [Fragaria vesca subsp. vesca]
MSSERASSSFPSSTSKWEYDVFLSFRGEDTRKGFTNTLYNSLVDQGIRTFMDDRELQKGKSISPELFTAIEESNIALVVLSLNYASSAWCLDELLKILECMEARNTIYPIFYNVDPCEVRRQTGNFAEAFTKHEERLSDDTEKVQKWRAALTKVSNFSGWNSKDYRYESELIKKIVAEVRMQSRPTLFSSMENLVGIDSRVEAVNSLLGVGMNDVHFIGIWGMGGIGKSTIAKVLFDRISHQFEFRDFISNVRRNVETSGLDQLQKKLISRMLGKETDVCSLEAGATTIRRFLRPRKVLLVLDDVNHSDQLDCLAGKEDWYGFGSVVIITTRDAHLLVKHGVVRRSEVQVLNTDEALQLFIQHAFRKGYPEQSYRDLSNQFVKYAKGLPLALKVLGSFLHGRDIPAWESALAKLRKVGNAEIFEALKISYDGLDDHEKSIFLDIALFHIGCKKQTVMHLLDACDFAATIGIDVLEKRSLLTIDAGILQMHDLLREMGLEIVRRESPDDPGKRSRLCLEEDIIHVLEKNRVRNLGTEAVKSIVLRVKKDAETLHLPGKSFSMMTNLRTLIITRSFHLSDGLEYLSSELRILMWLKCPLQSLASVISLENLRILEMCHSQIEYLWEGKKQLKSLKHIVLSHSLNLCKTPDFSGCPDLEYLNLEGCIQLYEVDSSVGFLKRLTMMHLKGCKNLRLLPSSVSGLKSLKILDLSDCSKLEKLPEDFGHLEILEELYVNRTALRELPPCMGLQNLKILSFYGCTGPPISKLLPSFAGLHSLTELNLSRSNLLEGAIPDNIGCLSSLKELYLAGNQFVTLPVSLSQLHRLELLFLNNCPNLQRLPKLPSRVLVSARECLSLEKVPEHLSRANFLYCLKLAKCTSVAFTSMKRHLQEVSQYLKEEARDTPFRFVIPGNEIPEWFDQTVTAPLSINLHPDSFCKEFVGFALCFVFAVHGHRQFPPVSNYWHQITCIVKVDGQEKSNEHFKFDHPLGRAVPDHLWFSYHNDISSYFRRADTTESKQIEFSFRVKGQGLVVKKYGVRLVYKQDVAEVNQSNVALSNEALEIPLSDSEKAAVVSHAIPKRGLPPHSQGGGPSGGGFSFYKEPQPDRLERLKSACARVKEPLLPSYLCDLIKSHPNKLKMLEEHRKTAHS